MKYPIQLSQLALRIFKEDIYPIYKKHEETFDPGGIHGIMHISRSIIASNILINTFKEHMYFGPAAVFIATAFHDSGRIANGVDYWEGQSYENCLKYCQTWTTLETSPEYIAGLIPKSLPKDDVNYKCVHDADVLEIMRPCCGHGGLGGFKKEFLMLYKGNEAWFNEFIPKWFKFIMLTEGRKAELSIPQCLEKLIDIFNELN